MTVTVNNLDDFIVDDLCLSIKEQVLKEYKTIIYEEDKITNIMTESFIRVLVSRIEKYYYNLLERQVKVNVSTKEFIELYLSSK